ncbi:CRISPR system precrRNA processing endoribonuclease RAMP protein Cas6 [Anoxybacillus geothermalis]|uniref:CRISPR system precrRNA processing endoribonuclease RAMP protein Cas6 n=1 Tax=Geobacillus stearothermophilus TaxID=1422 RepID=UPI002EB52A9B|nr:CRISPR system precrRNA processing endoribonuclease RAMP protein Cas6 [Anoxybacillus geothermalis]
MDFQSSLTQQIQRVSVRAIKVIFELKANTTGKMPFYSGSIWRGMWGREIREKSCLFPKEDCKKCLYVKQCAYGSLFEPTSEIFAPQMQENRKFLSPPMIVQAPFFKDGIWREGETKQLELILFGDAFKYIHYFIDSLKDIGIYGVGPNRISFMIESISQKLRNGQIKPLEQEAFVLDDLFYEDWEWELPERSVKSILLHFITPLRLQKKGNILRKFELEEFLLNCQRRLEYVTALYGKAVKINKEELLELAQRISVVHEEISWTDWERYSSKQKRTMNLGGIMGTVVLSGNITPILPMLYSCSFFHIGKQTVFGLGKFEVYQKFI